MNMLYHLRQAIYGALCGAVLSFGATTSWAQAIDTATIKGSATGTQEVNIEADSMEVQEAENKAIFTGNVTAERTGTRLTSDRMVVTYREVAQSDGSQRTDVALIDARGNVEIKTARQVITGEHAILDVAGDLLTVTGNVVVTEGSTVIRGAKLKADLKAKTSYMTGGRVKGSFVPDSSSN
jgi:lipopolysaccharide export system protein LptA